MTYQSDPHIGPQNLLGLILVSEDASIVTDVSFKA